MVLCQVKITENVANDERKGVLHSSWCRDNHNIWYDILRPTYYMVSPVFKGDILNLQGCMKENDRVKYSEGWATKQV
jgi:hypothetical protein